MDIAIKENEFFNETQGDVVFLDNTNDLAVVDGVEDVKQSVYLALSNSNFQNLGEQPTRNEISKGVRLIQETLNAHDRVESVDRIDIVGFIDNTLIIDLYITPFGQIELEV